MYILYIIILELGYWLECHLKCLKCLTAVCRRNTVEDPTIPRYTAFISREDPLIFRCSCDGSSRPKRVDPYGYHLVGCKIGANAIRLHDEVVAMVAKLFRSLRLDAIVEPLRLFSDADEDDMLDECCILSCIVYVFMI